MSADKELIEKLVPVPTVKRKRKPGRPAKHGVYSKEELLPLVDEKVQLIVDVLDGEELLVQAQDMILVRLLGRALARIEMVDRYILLVLLYLCSKNSGIVNMPDFR